MKRNFIKTFAILLVTATMMAACGKDEIGENDGKISLIHTAWSGKMVNTLFEDTYWEEELIFMSDSTALLFRTAIFEDELSGSRTIQTTYTFDGVSPAPYSAMRTSRSATKSSMTRSHSPSRTISPTYFTQWKY